MTVSRTENHRSRALDPALDANPEGATAAAAARTTQAPAQGTPRGKDALVRASDMQKQAQLGTFAKADAQRSRVDAARTAVRELAAAVGQDPSAFAARYASSNKSPAEIQKEARFAFVQETLAQHPERADALIAVRVRGLGADSRELVTAAVKQSGARGANRYAACERAITKLAGLDGDTRGDALGLVKAGVPFDQAVSQSKAESAAVAAADAKRAAPANTTSLTGQALAGSKAQAEAVRKVTGQVHRTVHALGKLSRVSEVVVGVGAATGTVGSSVFATGESLARRSIRPLEKAAHEAERAGGFVMGELTTKIRAADRTAGELLETAGRFEAVYARNVAAIRNYDPVVVAETRREMDTLTVRVKELGSSLAAQAQSIGKLNRDFDGAAEHAALSAALAPLMYVAGSAPVVHKAVGVAVKAAASHSAPLVGQAAGRAVGGATEIAIHAGVEGAVARGYGVVRH